MKLTGRIWILATALAFSLISIIHAEAYTKLLIFVLVLGVFYSPRFTKSKAGKLIIVLIFIATIAFLINSSIEEGAQISSINPESESYVQGLRQGEIITQLNGDLISSPQDFLEKINSILPSDQEIRIDVKTNRGDYVIFTKDPLNLTVTEIPKTQLQTGLDISGGARALVQPDAEITDAELNDLIAVSRNRFNVFGLSDVKIRGVTDFSGNKFMLIEVAGATPQDLEDLVSQQGKFEAKIGEEVAFVGGDKDITNVCRNDATCASITGCFAQGAASHTCSFSFTIYLSEEAAQRHADITAAIPLAAESGGRYLEENLTLILDDNPVDELLISAGLKGQKTTQISIQGSGQGATQEEAYQDAQSSMNHLQTILITGSLPYKLTIEKLDTISPLLGNQFINLILLAGVSAILVVGIVVFIRYKTFKLPLALLLTAFSELLIILGIAAFIKWNLDLPSIAGILATIGTGVDQQIVILDEARSGQGANISRKIKRALFVVMAAYATSLVALLPLYWAGAGLFKGFALTSIIGITAGVFITRPAFADMVKALEKKE